MGAWWWLLRKCTLHPYQAIDTPGQTVTVIKGWINGFQCLSDGICGIDSGVQMLSSLERQLSGLPRFSGDAAHGTHTDTTEILSGKLEWTYKG